jgi:hypothetical protein
MNEIRNNGYNTENLKNKTATNLRNIITGLGIEIGEKHMPKSSYIDIIMKNNSKSNEIVEKLLDNNLNTNNSNSNGLIDCNGGNITKTQNIINSQSKFQENSQNSLHNLVNLNNLDIKNKMAANNSNLNTPVNYHEKDDVNTKTLSNNFLKSKRDTDRIHLNSNTHQNHNIIPNNEININKFSNKQLNQHNASSNRNLNSSQQNLNKNNYSNYGQPMAQSNFTTNSLNMNNKKILVNNAFNNTKIDLQENNNPQSRFNSQNLFALQNNMVPIQQSTSGIKRQNTSNLSANNSKLNINRHNQGGVSRSHISTVSQGRRSQIGAVRPSGRYPPIFLKPFANITKDVHQNPDYQIDISHLMQVIGGSLAVYGGICYLYQYGDSNHFSGFNLDNMIKLTVDNQDLLLKGSTVLILGLLVFLCISYFKQKQEYQEQCRLLAERCYEDTCSYFSEKEMKNTQLHMSVEDLTSDLSRQFGYSKERFTHEIWNLHLENLFLNDERFKVGQQVENGEIQTNLIYENLNL